MKIKIKQADLTDEIQLRMFDKGCAWIGTGAKFYETYTDCALSDKAMSQEEIQKGDLVLTPEQINTIFPPIKPKLSQLAPKLQSLIDEHGEIQLLAKDNTVEVQKALFELGKVWRGTYSEPKYLNSSIFFRKANYLTQSDDPDYRSGTLIHLTPDLEGWKKEFYPISGEDAAKGSELEQVEHAIQKWKGALPENLKKHGIEKAIDLGEDAWGHEGCSLCQAQGVTGVSRENCSECPFMKVLGNTCNVDLMNPQKTINDLQKIKEELVKKTYKIGTYWQKGPTIKRLVKLDQNEAAAVFKDGSAHYIKGLTWKGCGIYSYLNEDDFLKCVDGKGWEQVDGYNPKNI